MTQETKFDVLGIGNAIVDVIAKTDNAFLRAEGLDKGHMGLIDTARANDLYGKMNVSLKTSGGSVANTTVGIASLGGTAAFIGKLGDDELGDGYAQDLAAVGVHFAVKRARKESLPTGRCLILVTPDAERTMSTYLGASGLLTGEDIDPVLVKAAKVTYLEGYRFDLAETKAAFYRAAKLARAAGRKVALSLSDKFCVLSHRQHFLDLIEGYVDILFANESEIEGLYETRFDDAAEIVRKKVEIACLTRGAHGSEIVTPLHSMRIPATPVQKVIDTTGAGDLYAAGFLFGYTREMSLEECGRIASAAAAEVIGHYGPRPAVSLAGLIETG